MKRLLYIFLTYFLSSCSDALDDVSTENNKETINGFNVEWRTQITSKQKDVVKKILNDMVRVEGGYFTMGGTPEQNGLARNNEYPNIYVKLSDYYICKYEVSDEQFNTITGYDVHCSENYASRMTLNDWRMFIDVLSDLCSITFSLPTEAQWEYAARGGKLTHNYIYPGSNELSEIHSSSHINGSQVPNELGIYNLADLKSEWCADLYDEYSGNGLSIDRLCIIGEDHVVRGGNYLCNKEGDKYYQEDSSITTYCLSYGNRITDPRLDYRHCRITSRSYEYDHEIGNTYVGCRLVININNAEKWNL